MRGDEGDSLLLIRQYYERFADDPNGLTFRRWVAKKGETLVVNSSELRAVSEHQLDDLVLSPVNPPKLRQKLGRAKKGKGARAADEIHYPTNQRWMLDPEIDRDTRKVCEAA